MAETEICKIRNWEKLKTKATNQSGSVQAMFEQETFFFSCPVLAREKKFYVSSKVEKLAQNTTRS